MRTALSTLLVAWNKHLDASLFCGQNKYDNSHVMNCPVRNDMFSFRFRLLTDGHGHFKAVLLTDKFLIFYLIHNI